VEIIDRGMVEYTERAFSQDAQEAMGGDMYRAFAELITNSDDSYARLGKSKGRPVKGGILIEVEHRKGTNWKMIIRDRAEGMTTKEMKAKLTVLGERTSGFASGEQVRGLLGRGGKDVAAFGRVMWECVRDGRYNRLDLEPTGTWELYRPRRVDPEVRKRLGIPRGDGTVVTVNVDKGFRCPWHRTLCEKLPRHYSLRDIMSDPNRKNLLVNLNEKGHKGDKLQYSYPEGELKTDEEEMAIPGYPEVTAHLKIWRHGTRFDEDKRSPFRENGILVRSGRAIHQISLFGLETDAYSEWFFGKLDCPYIDTLVNEYDERHAAREPHPESNPTRLISRRREGLAPNHPFTQALFEVARERLKLLVEKEREAEEERHRRIESRETKARLSRLAAAARRFMVKKMREFDEEVDLAGVVIGDRLVPDLKIIPGGCKLPPGETKTFSVLSRAELDASAEVRLRIASGSSGIAISRKEIRLRRHPKIENALRGAFKVEAIAEDGFGIVEAERNGFLDQASVEVGEREIEIVVPEELTFEKPSYNLVYGKRKSVKILAPKSLVDIAGPIVHVTSTDPQHIVVRRQKVKLRMSQDGEYAIGETQVEGRKLDAKAVLHAALGRALASAKAKVVQRRLTGPPIEFRVVNESWGPQRAIWSPPDGYLLKIAGKHESIGRYLGPADKGFPGQESPHFRLLLAEISAASVCQRLLIEKDKGSSVRLDMDRVSFYHDHLRLMGEFLPTAHRAMLSKQEAEVLRESSVRESGKRRA